MKNVNNKLLLLVCAALLATFGLAKFVLAPARSSNLNVARFKLDTATITAVRLHGPNDTLPEIMLTRQGTRWQATQHNITATVPHQKINSLLHTAAALRPERIVSRKKEKWHEYDLGDSTAKSVSFYNNNQPVMTLKLGKETAGNTYVRVDEDNDVYLLNGALTSSISTVFSDWRDQTLLQFGIDQVRKIDFHYPADSGFTVERQNKQWMVSAQPADSTGIKSYLGKINHQTADTFADTFKPLKDPDITVTYTLADNQQVVLKGWLQSFDAWVLNSSIQPDVYFMDKGPRIIDDIFIGKKALTKRP